MTTQKTFDVLLLIARPAAGKSEIIDQLKKTPLEERISRFHIGEFDEIDDFPMLWTWFEEDRILEDLGHPRLHSNTRLYFKENYFWDVLTRRICLEYQKKLRDNSEYHQTKTALVEFARGTEHGGFARAFQYLSRELVEKMAILYVHVSWEESFRKNQKRYNPNRPDSILEHGLPDEKMEKLYRYVDWEEISAGNPDFIEIQEVKVPYVVFENEDDVTTKRGEALANRLGEALGKLWESYSQ